jgi:hypothetical protein
MKMLLFGHEPTKPRLRALAQALRTLCGNQNVTVYFNGDLTALCSTPELVQRANAIVLGLSHFSRDEDSAECAAERTMLEIAVRAGAACFLVPDEAGIDAAYLTELGGKVTGVVVCKDEQRKSAARLCPTAYPYRVNNFMVEVKGIAGHIHGIAQSPGHTLPV